MFNQKGNAILPSAGFTENHIDQFMQASNELIVYALHKK
jgi:hypothetical protein